MPATRLKDRVHLANVAPRNNTGPTNKRSTNVGKNVAVQVATDNDVELLGLGNHLHRGVVDDHLVELDPDALVLLADLPANLQKEPIGKFPEKKN
jgi:hypothetical protein